MTLTATLTKGEARATKTFMLTVVEVIMGVEFIEALAVISLPVEQTYALSSDSSDTITWSSSDTNIATVSNDGTVTAQALGTATITASNSEGSDTILVRGVNSVGFLTEVSEWHTNAAFGSADEVSIVDDNGSVNSNATYNANVTDDVAEGRRAVSVATGGVSILKIPVSQDISEYTHIAFSMQSYRFA